MRVTVGVTVNELLLLGTPLIVTTTLAAPAERPAGADTAIELALQLVGEAKMPLKVTVLLPCADPKPVPAIVIEVLAGPEPGEMLEITGTTVNLTTLLTLPATVTI